MFEITGIDFLVPALVRSKSNDSSFSDKVDVDLKNKKVYGLEEARLFLGETGELSNLESMGLFVIDTADLPGYKVFLLGANDDPNWKELAFQQIGQDCTDIAQQLIKIPPKFLPHHALCNIIQKWYEKYGKIYVMSHNPKYLRVYVHMLQRVGFDVKNPLS